MPHRLSVSLPTTIRQKFLQYEQSEPSRVHTIGLILAIRLKSEEIVSGKEIKGYSRYS
jgi:hypothetical protein